MQAIVCGTHSWTALLEHCLFVLVAVLCFLFFYCSDIFLFKSLVFVFEQFEAQWPSLFTFMLLQCLLMGGTQVNCLNDRDD